MQKKTLRFHRSKNYSEIENRLMSFAPVNRNGWWIKFSTLRETNVLLLFTSKYTGQTILRYFDHEDDAVEFINFIIAHDAREEIPQEY
jgi:hypothetical protein